MIRYTLFTVVASLPLLSGVMSTEHQAHACLSGDGPRCQELIAKRCDDGVAIACRRLAIETFNECASPGHLGGCFYDSRSYR